MRISSIVSRGAAAFFAVAIMAQPFAAAAETTLERVTRTGVLNAGTRTDAMPFAYVQPDGKLGGLSVDVLREIRAGVESAVGKPVELRLQPVTPANRIELVKSGAIDVECGITTPTWEREEAVDFSIPFFGNGTRVLALRGAVNSLDDLQGKRVGVIKGSTTLAIVTAAVPGAKLVEVADTETGVKMLEKGDIDALSNLGAVLRAQLEGSPLKSKVLLLPRNGALSFEPIACMTPKNDSVWRDVVNRAIADMLEGIESYRGTFMKIHDRWLGPAGPVYYPLDRVVAQRLAAAVVWLK